MIKKNVVVIPIYKNFSILEKSELQSLNRCLEILSKHPIVFFGPSDIFWSDYENHAKNSFNVFVRIELFNNDFFKNVNGYNKLLLSSSFYKRFNNYDYMLIYQLDAWVFRDELDFWCNKNYHYIGAPWFDGYHIQNQNEKFIGVGNGGFSLRNIKKSFSVLRKVNILKKTVVKKNVIILSKLSFLVKLFCFVFKFRKDIFLEIYNNNLTAKEFLSFEENEDIFWGLKVPMLFCDYKVPEPQIALKFSFETNPSYLYHLNNNNLPFGCHAWLKYNPDFYKKFINIET
jgi:hypothetical protein